MFNYTIILKIMNSMFKKLFVSAATMLLLDLIYLTSSSGLWNKHMIHLQGSPLKIRIVPTVIVYVSMLMGLVYFILMPHEQHKNKMLAVRNAALFGFVLFSVYEFTNYAILKKWKPLYVVMDTLWGPVLYGITTYVTLSLVK